MGNFETEEIRRGLTPYKEGKKHQMKPATIVTLSEVSDKPKIKLDLPSPLRIGDRVYLQFSLKREKGGRTEQLDVNGTFRVMELHFEEGRQHITVEFVAAAGKPSPSWRAVKKEVPVPRTLPPAISPRTPLS